MFEHTSRQHLIFVGIILLVAFTPGATSAQAAAPEDAMESPEDTAGPANQPYEKSVFFIQSPYRSLEKNRQFIDTIVLRTILPLGYVEEQSTDDLKQPSHAQLYRYFVKPLENGSGKEIELFVASYSEAGGECN